MGAIKCHPLEDRNYRDSKLVIPFFPLFAAITNQQI